MFGDTSTTAYRKIPKQPQLVRVLRYPSIVAKYCGPIELRNESMHVKITTAGVRGYTTARHVKAGFYGIEIIFCWEGG